MVYKFYMIENFFYKIKIIPLALLVRLLIRIIFSCDITDKVKIGKNRQIFLHILGVVFQQEIVIGNNCKILQNVTVGGKSNSPKFPTIGDSILIGLMQEDIYAH